MKSSGLRFLVHESVPPGDGGTSLGQALVAGLHPLDHNEFILPRECLLYKLMVMCLAIPAKVLSVEDGAAQVDFGRGVSREVNVMLVEAKIDDYVLVHAGYAIQVLDEKEAQETLRLWNEILGAEDRLEEKTSKR